MEEPGPPGGLSQDQGKDKQEGLWERVVSLPAQPPAQGKDCAVLDPSLRESSR